MTGIDCHLRAHSSPSNPADPSSNFTRGPTSQKQRLPIHRSRQPRRISKNSPYPRATEFPPTSPPRHFKPYAPRPPAWACTCSHLPHQVRRTRHVHRPRAGLAHSLRPRRKGVGTARRPAQHRPRNPPAVTKRQPHPSNKLRAAANGPAPLPNRKAKP
jgi:hypothetical protein